MESNRAADIQEDVLYRGERRLAEAHNILEELELFRLWSDYGRPVLVGATAYGLVVRPDIDMEIFCEQPNVADGFAIVSELALNPAVWKVRFSNELQGPDAGLYWQLRYRNPSSAGQEVWKIDMWLLAESHPGPRSADLVETMRRALTPQTRASILLIKEATAENAAVHGIDIYRAVLDGGVRTPQEFNTWFAKHGPLGLTAWQPSIG